MIQLGGYAAIEYCEGPRINFRMGREDVEEIPESHSSALSQNTAYEQFAETGLTKREIVALMGRRTLGFY